MPGDEATQCNLVSTMTKTLLADQTARNNARFKGRPNKYRAAPLDSASRPGTEHPRMTLFIPGDSLQNTLRFSENDKPRINIPVKIRTFLAAYLEVGGAGARPDTRRETFDSIARAS